MFMRVNSKCAHQVRPPSRSDRVAHEERIRKTNRLLEDDWKSRVPGKYQVPRAVEAP
jgi:hypothetical protein